MVATSYCKTLFENFTLLMFVSHFRVCTTKKDIGLIYILQWTHSPFPPLEKEHDAFFNKKCVYQNCFVTDNVSYLSNITDFDALIFHAMELRVNESLPLPKHRSPKQKYVLVTRESSTYYPLPPSFDGYFNWTWTYKLDSDISYKYITVRNKRGKVIGPKKEMHWLSIDQMKPTSKYVKRKLKYKTLAVAWFVSNCESSSKRELYVQNLQHELVPFGLSIDIYGSCGDNNCPRDGWEQECHAAIESDYYFYLAFENSFAEDYVTEKLLTALEHFAVPVVLGGANYTRFVPDGIYLNACKLSPKELAMEINDAIRNKQKYYDYFRWHNHYSFHDASEKPDTDGICQFCEKLNFYLKVENYTSIHTNFSTWWNISNLVHDRYSCVKENSNPAF